MIRIGKYDYEKVSVLLKKWDERRREASEYASVGGGRTLKLIARCEANAIMKCIDELKSVMFDPAE